MFIYSRHPIDVRKKKLQWCHNSSCDIIDIIYPKRTKSFVQGFDFHLKYEDGYNVQYSYFDLIFKMNFCYLDFFLWSISCFFYVVLYDIKRNCVCKGRRQGQKTDSIYTFFIWVLQVPLLLPNAIDHWRRKMQ